MNLCKTDLNTLIRLLQTGAELIDRHCDKPRDADVARRMKQFSKKLKKKQDNDRKQHHPRPSCDGSNENLPKQIFELAYFKIAKSAYNAADCMIAERERTDNQVKEE